MKLILIFLFLIACTPSIAQVRVKVEVPPAEKVTIAERTTIVASGKNAFRVITSDDSIAHKMTKRFEKNECYRIVYDRKDDRYGSYWERSFYFKNENWNAVIIFVNNRFK